MDEVRVDDGAARSEAGGRRYPRILLEQPIFSRHLSPLVRPTTPTDTMHAATARIFGPVASASRTRRVSARRLSRASNRRVVVAPLKAKEAEPGDAVEEISTAMADARVCEESGLSPGAGLADADAQADAAFADMINTTIDVTGEALDSEELSRLSRAGRMDEESKSKKSGGILGDVKDLFGALSKGAHIVKQKGGRV